MAKEEEEEEEKKKKKKERGEIAQISTVLRGLVCG